MFAIKYIQSYYRTSQIQFENAAISAQAGHPSVLSLPDDILLMILDILQSGDRDPWTVWHSLEHRRGDFVRASMTCKRLRLLAVPRLFRTVRFGPGWSLDKMGQELDKIGRSSDLQDFFSYRVFTYHPGIAGMDQTLSARPLPGSIDEHVRALKVYHWSGTITTQALAVSRQLVAWIQTLPNLNSLWVSCSETLVMPLKTAFQDKAIVLPNITELKISSSMEWIMYHCPNLRLLDASDYHQSTWRHLGCDVHFVTEVGKLAHLQHLVMHCSLDEPLFDHLVSSIPQLKILSIASGKSNTTLSSILHILSRMPRLERLDLVSTRQMDPPTLPWDMAPSHDPSIRMRMLESDQRITPAQERITEMAFRALPYLRELRIGRKFNAKMRLRGGRVGMRFLADSRDGSAVIMRDVVVRRDGMDGWEVVG